MEKQDNNENIQTEIKINTPFIKLDAFIKFCGEAVTGADAKELVLNGEAKVNDDVCVQRGKKLFDGDKVEISNKIYKVSQSCEF